MNQNSWSVQVYCFARHTHREHGIPPPPHPSNPNPPLPAFRFPRKLAPDRFPRKILEMILTYSWFPDPSSRFVQTIFVSPGTY